MDLRGQLLNRTLTDMRICETFPKLVVGLVAALLLAEGSDAQTCTDAGLLSVLRVLSEYSDVTATCETASLESGEVSYVDVAYDMYPDLFSFVSSHSSLLHWNLYLSPQDVDIDALLNAERRDPSAFWSIALDDDGDVKFSRYIKARSDEDIEGELVKGTMEVFAYLKTYPNPKGSESKEVGTPTLDDQDDMYEKSVQGCMRGVLSELAGEEIPEEMNVRGYCECIADKLKSNPDGISDIFNAGSQGLNSLTEGCMEVLMPGLEALDFNDFDDDKVQEAVKRGYMRGCLREARNLLNDLGVYNNDVSEEYCLCMYENMRAQDTFKMSDFEDENSVLMTEIDAKCSHILTGSSSSAPAQYWNDLDGCFGLRTTPYLINSAGEVKVKVSFDGIEKYMTLDSGCSEVLLNEDLAKELKISGAIGPGDYLGLEMFVMADGREVAVEKYRIREMKVGSCVVDNFIVGVMEEGGMLLGMGYLGLFDAWELDQSTQTLRTTR